MLLDPADGYRYLRLPVVGEPDSSIMVGITAPAEVAEYIGVPNENKPPENVMFLVENMADPLEKLNVTLEDAFTLNDELLGVLALNPVELYSTLADVDSI